MTKNVFHLSEVNGIIKHHLEIFTMTQTTQKVPFKTNQHLMDLIQKGIERFNCTDIEYIDKLVQRSLDEFEHRIQHENPSKVLAHYQDAMDFFKFNDAVIEKLPIDRPTALTVKLTAKEYEKDMTDLFTMFICYSILRD